MSTELILKACEGIETKLQKQAIEQTVINDRLMQLEQRATPMDRAGGSRQASPRTYGSLVWEELQRNQDLFQKTRSLRLSLKAAADPITTTSARTVSMGGVGAPVGNVLGIQNALIQTSAPGTTAKEYSRFTGTQGAAAQQAAEGDTKAAIRPDHTLVTQKSLTVAGYCKLTEQASNDSNELKAAIDVTLARSTLTALDVLLCNGGTDFVGGFETLATAYTSLVYQRMADAISEGVSTMQVAGFSPNVVVLNPADWLAAVVAKGTANDHYLSGNYLGALPMEMRGLRVVLSPSVDAGKALLMDSAHSELFVVDQYEVQIDRINDDFIKNMVTIRGEMRVIPVFRTVGSARLITPKA